jgi:hypothetical protein
MSSHTRGPRKRSRKPRSSKPGTGQGFDRDGGGSSRSANASAGQAQTPSGHSETVTSRVRGASLRGRPGPSPAKGTSPVARTFGERPRAAWHPLPLSEILILVGAIGAAIGLSRGFSGLHLMLAGIVAVALGTIEVTLREHRSGFRSHTLLLSLLPVVVLHSATVLLVAAFTTAPRWLNAGLLVLDVALFLVLFKLWRARFLGGRARLAARR